MIIANSNGINRQIKKVFYVNPVNCLACSHAQENANDQAALRG